MPKSYAQTLHSDPFTQTHDFSHAENILNPISSLIEWVQESGLIEILEGIPNGSTIRVNTETQNV